MKGLEALEEINKVIPYFHITNEYKVIKKELKDYATLYEELNAALNLNECQNVKEWIALIKKKLKALEIIKEMFLNGTDVTKVLLSIYQSKDFEEFQQTHLFANKNKYQLLKELLSDGH